VRRKSTLFKIEGERPDCADEVRLVGEIPCGHGKGSGETGKNGLKKGRAGREGKRIARRF